MHPGFPALELHQGLPVIKGPAIRRGIGLGHVAVRNSAPQRYRDKTGPIGPNDLSLKTLRV